MRPFDYFEPDSLEEAVRLLGQYGSQASVLAGGTDLLVEIKEHLRRPEQVINIKRIPGLETVTCDPVQGLRFGALVTARTLEIEPFVKAHYPGFARALEELGSIQVRNRATVAGNICRASPSADTPPPLIANDARVQIFGPAGLREASLESFFTGPGQTILGEDELLVEVQVPFPAPGTGQAYLKHGRRKAMELATVGVAARVRLEAGLCRSVRIVLGAVAPTPIRVVQAEAELLGSQLSSDDLERAGEAAMREARPISDVRASAAYRSEMVRILTMRAIEQAAARAGA